MSIWADLEERDRQVREETRAESEKEITRLVAERDKAREECGHEKAMRASIREEMYRWIEAARTAEAKVSAIEALAERWVSLAPADDWGDSLDDTILSDAGRQILAAIEGTP
jgi:DNA repair exonuclease SbcCD ATPase subunit